jgi:flagellar FliL protein
MPRDKTDRDLDETAVAEGEDTESKPEKKRFPRLFIYIAISLAMVVVGYFGSQKFLGTIGDKRGSEVAEQDQEESKSETPKDTEMVMVDDIIVNPAGTGGTRFLSASIGFEISSKESVERFNKRLPIIRDALISILGSKTLEQLSDAKEKEIARYQIRKRIAQLLETEEIAGVYFTDFVLQ